MSKLVIDGKEVLSEKVAHGVWTALGTWTLPPFTLNGTLTLNGQVFDAGSENARINTTGAWGGLDVVASHANGLGANLSLYHNSASPVNNDQIGRILFSGNTEASNGFPADTNIAMGGFVCKVVDVTDETEDAIFEWSLRDVGAYNLAMTLSGAGVLDILDSLKVNGTQVVSAQGAAVANPTDPASTQARLIDLLGRLRTHGLIAV